MNGGIRRLWNALRWSWHGLATTYREEAAFRQEVWLALLLLPLVFLLDVSRAERALLLGALLLPLTAELLNTGIEAAADLVTKEKQPLAKKAKDAGSAAVFLALVIAGAVWLLIALPAVL